MIMCMINFKIIVIELMFLFAGISIPIVAHKMCTKRDGVFLIECLFAVLMFIFLCLLRSEGYLPQTQFELCGEISFFCGMECDYRLRQLKGTRGGFNTFNLFFKWFLLLIFLRILFVVYNKFRF